MPTLVVTFAFATDANGFVAHPASPSVLSFDASNGNPAGALKSSASGSNLANNNSWQQSLTFQQMGVPANATVTAITGGSMQSKCTAFTHAQNSVSGAATLQHGGTSVFLSNTRTLFSVDSGWVTTAGTDKTGVAWPSSDAVIISIGNFLTTLANGSVTLYQDNLTFTVSYSLNPDTGALATTENGSDAAAAGARLAVHGGLADSESVGDVLALAAALSVHGSFSGGDGVDHATASVLTQILATLAASEIVVDMLALTAAAHIAGAVAASDAADALAILGQTQPLSGTVSAAEAASDIFAAAGGIGHPLIIGSVVAASFAVPSPPDAGRLTISGSIVAVAPIVTPPPVADAPTVIASIIATPE